VSGDFQCMLAVSVSDELGARDRIDVARRVCAGLATRVFVGDESHDPFAGVVIEDATKSRSASLDPDADEERGEYRLWRAS